MALKSYLETMAKNRDDNSQIYKDIFAENCVEDREDNILILDNAGRTIHKKFSVSIEDPSIWGTIFYIVYNAIIEHIVSKEKEYSSYQLSVCDRFVVGYDNDEDEDNEKIGNFAIQIKDRGMNIDATDVDDPTITAREKCVRWNAENVINQADDIRNIAIRSRDLLQIAGIRLASPELIMPIFITIYQHLISFLKIRRRELDQFEYQCNFMSCFYIYARESEQGDDIIAIKPSIGDKLNAKNDEAANKLV